MMPQDAPEQPAPDRLQFTLVSAAPVTVAVNCWWTPVRSVGVFGETLTATGGPTVTLAVADFVGSASDVAVTKICGGFGTAPGAVYRPADVMAPQAAPEQPVPLTLQATLVFAEPV